MEESATEKSKAQLRAERRALQEAQRAAKTANKSAGGPAAAKAPAATASSNKPPQSKKESHKPTQRQTAALPDKAAGASKASVAKPTPASLEHSSGSTGARRSTTQPSAASSNSLPVRKQAECRVHLFRHLQQPDKRIDVIGRLGLGRNSLIHPTFLALGVDYDEGRISGSNERCVRLLTACNTLIRAYSSTTTTTGQKSARDFGTVLQRHVDFLATCRPLSITMRNALDEIERKLAQLDEEPDWNKCSQELVDKIDAYRHVSIELAGQEIACRLQSCIHNGDCIVVFAYSSLVGHALLQAASAGLVFSVIVVDSRPRFEGRRMLKLLLSRNNIACEYTHIGGLPTLAHKVTLAVFGAHALLANGYVLSRVGTGQVANIVSSLSKVSAPVLICAETYKFTERAHSDAIEYNEVGNPDDLLSNLDDKASPLSSNWRTDGGPTLLQLVYDLLPPELVAAVVTENGMLPTSSVPVVLRRKEMPVEAGG